MARVGEDGCEVASMVSSMVASMVLPLLSIWSRVVGDVDPYRCRCALRKILRSVKDQFEDDTRGCRKSGAGAWMQGARIVARG